MKKRQLLLAMNQVKIYGGEICQVATTLYNAVLIAGFPVIERHRHTIPVGYVPYDKDAATYEDIKD